MVCEQEHCCAPTKNLNQSVFQHLEPFPLLARADMKQLWHLYSEEPDTVLPPWWIRHVTWASPISCACISMISLQRICGQLLAEPRLFYQLFSVRSETHLRTTQNNKFRKYSTSLSKSVSALAGRGNGAKCWKILWFIFFCLCTTMFLLTEHENSRNSWKTRKLRFCLG